MALIYYQEEIPTCTLGEHKWSLSSCQVVELPSLDFSISHQVHVQELCVQLPPGKLCNQHPMRRTYHPQAAMKLKPTKIISGGLAWLVMKISTHKSCLPYGTQCTSTKNIEFCNEVYVLNLASLTALLTTTHGVTQFVKTTTPSWLCSAT